MSFETVMPPYNASDPSATFLSSSCLDFLLIELVPMAYRVANEVEAQAQEQMPPPPFPPTAASGSGPADATAAQSLDGTAGTVSTHAGAPGAGGSATAGTGTGTGATLAAGGGGGGGARRMDEDEERDAVFFRLETLGYRVGQGLVERFSRDRPRFTDTLDVIKFLCKDLWTLVFRKQVDNLKTNHRVRLFSHHINGWGGGNWGGSPGGVGREF